MGGYTDNDLLLVIDTSPTIAVFTTSDIRVYITTHFDTFFIFFNILKIEIKLYKFETGINISYTFIFKIF